MTPRKIALAGLGAAARSIHLPAYRRIAGLEVVGGCDPAATSGWPFPTFATAEEMLETTRPDLLAVLAPPAAHGALVRLGLEAGCHVLCEKPFTPTLEEAHALVELAAARGRRIVVNQQYRFMNVHRAARDLIRAPELGELLFLRAEQTFHRDDATEAGWRGQDPQRTCKEFGIHVLDLCRFFFDEEPRSLHARMPKPDGTGQADHLDLIDLEFSGGRVAHIVLDRLCRGRHRYLNLRLDGSAGCVETRLGGGLEIGAGIRGGTRRPFLGFDLSLGGRARLYHGERFRKIAADPLDLFAHATRRLVEAFLDALDRDAVPPCDAGDNVRSLALMLAAYESDRRGERLRIRPDGAGWNPPGGD